MSAQCIWLTALALLVPLAAAPNTGTITGKVTFQGKPMAEGLVTFITGRTKVVAPVRNGAYKVSGVPVGKALIIVESRDLKSPSGKAPGKSMPLPFTVQAGLQEHDIVLK
jgi:hypothetical protein